SGRSRGFIERNTSHVDDPVIESVNFLHGSTGSRQFGSRDVFCAPKRKHRGGRKFKISTLNLLYFSGGLVAHVRIAKEDRWKNNRRAHPTGGALLLLIMIWQGLNAREIKFGTRAWKA